jgi:zinc transporter ZupT
MKRTFVFLLLGPILVAFTPWGIAVAGGRRIKGGFDELCAVILFGFTLLVAAAALPLDQYLAHALPRLLRASLIAITGAATAAGLIFAVVRIVLPQWAKQPQWALIPFAIGAAVCMGLCSVLSPD